LNWFAGRCGYDAVASVDYTGPAFLSYQAHDESILTRVAMITKRTPEKVI
jgi:hypothetical protein